MPKKEKLKAKAAAVANVSKPIVAKTKKAKKAKAAKPKKAKSAKAGGKSKKGSKGFQVAESVEKAEILSSEVVWECALFRVRHDKW